MDSLFKDLVRNQKSAESPASPLPYHACLGSAQTPPFQRDHAVLLRPRPYPPKRRDHLGIGPERAVEMPVSLPTSATGLDQKPSLRTNLRLPSPI